MWFSIRGLVLSRELDIPPPILKENADEYFELLANEKDADRWIEKYSIDTYTSIDNTNKQMSDKKYSIEDPKINQYPLLKNITAKRIFLTVPIRLWFSKAYKSKSDPLDRHYHEFEPWQFDWLLEKSGWKIIKKEYWKNPSSKIGFRPLLRRFTNRYYAVYAERSKENYTNYYKGVLNL